MKKKCASTHTHTQEKIKSIENCATKRKAKEEEQEEEGEKK